MKTHELKSHPHFFEALKRGDKNFEIRRNDRNYQVGDTLVIRGYDPTFGLLLGEPSLRFTITYIMNTEDFPAIQPGFVIMGIKPVSAAIPDADAESAHTNGKRWSYINTSERGYFEETVNSDQTQIASYRIIPGDDVRDIYIRNKRIGYVENDTLFLIGKEGHAEAICDVDDLDCLPSLLQQHYRAI